jgi:hypothetical protein
VTTLAKAVEKIRPPGCKLILEPWAFADSWERKPSGNVCVGLRILSEAENTTARAEAATLARQLHPEGGDEQTDCFNDALLRWLVATAVCDPNNVDSPAPVFGATDEELIRVAMTERGIRFVFDSLLKYQVETSPLYPEIGDDELGELSTLMLGGAADLLPPGARSTAKRHLLFALDALRLARPEAAQ